MMPAEGAILLQEYRDRGFQVSLQVMSSGYSISLRDSAGRKAQASHAIPLKYNVSADDLRDAIDMAICLLQ